MNGKPLVSIITVSYNSEEFIVDTIQSVLDQTYTNIEHVIVDGNSSDNTVNIIKKFEAKYLNNDKKINWISENDEGIYNAMNKGVSLAKGEIIGFLNSDDFLYDKKVISRIVNEFINNDEIEGIYGSLIYTKQYNLNHITKISDFKNSFKLMNKFMFGWHPPHLTFYVKKDVYEKYGYFDTSFDIAADLEIMARFIEKYKIKLSYIPKYLVVMREGGISNNSIKNFFKINLPESYNALKSNDIFPYFIFLRPIRKIYRKIKAKIFNFFGINLKS